MQLYKFKLFIFLLIIPVVGQSAFELDQCLSSNFTVAVSHKSFPFGLLSRKLVVEKQNCLITVSHEKFKYMKNKWILDVCRGPIHIKKDDGAISVFKRTGACAKRDDEYCENVDSILGEIQDDGLIFAPGQKESIETDHGKIYCSFLLLKKYLENGHVFSKDGESSDSFSSGNKNRKEAKETSMKEEADTPVDDGPADF